MFYSAREHYTYCSAVSTSWCNKLLWGKCSASWFFLHSSLFSCTYHAIWGRHLQRFHARKGMHSFCLTKKTVFIKRPFIFIEPCLHVLWCDKKLLNTCILNLQVRNICQSGHILKVLSNGNYMGEGGGGVKIGINRSIMIYSLAGKCRKIYAGTELVFKPVCWDFSEINHCLLRWWSWMVMNTEQPSP